jgi:hypothetical protein
MNKFVLASLLGAAVMFAGQAPATPSKAQTSSQPAPATTTKVKKHHKKVKTAPATSTNATSKPAAKQ